MQDFERLEFKITLAKLALLSPAWDSATRTREMLVAPFNRLYMPLEGEGTISHHGRSFRLTPGKLYLVPPYSQLEFKTESRLLKYYLHFNAFLPKSKLDVFSIHECAYEIDAENPELLKALLGKIAAHYSWLNAKPDPVDEFECKTAAALLACPFFAKMSRKTGKGGTTVKERFGSLLNFIERNLDRRLTLNELAKEAKLNPTYLSNLFAEEMGVSLINYCNHRRVQEAIALLKNSESSISEIAFKTGFNDIASFSRLFKKYTLRPPSKYRASREEREASSDDAL